MKRTRIKLSVPLVVLALLAIGFTTACDPAPGCGAGSTDQTAAIQSLIDGTPDGGSLTLSSANTCYDVENTVYIRNRHNLTIDLSGDNFTRKVHHDSNDPANTGCHLEPQGCISRQHILIQGSSSIHLTNGIITGEKPDQANATEQCAGFCENVESQSGIQIDSSSFVEVDHMTIEHVHGDGFYTTGGANNLNLHDNLINQVGRHGFAINYCQTCTIGPYNSTDSTHRWSMDFEGLPTDVHDHIIVAGNTFLNPTIGFINAWSNTTNSVFAYNTEAYT